jgi:hypothetical protein
VVQIGRGPGLAAEALHERPVRRELGEQHLEGHRPVEQQIPRQVHLGHPTAREVADDLVSPGEDLLGHSGASLGRRDTPA